MTVTVTLRERGSNAFLELRSLFISLSGKERNGALPLERAVSDRTYCADPLS